jgi:hypothetical protein
VAGRGQGGTGGGGRLGTHLTGGSHLSVTGREGEGKVGQRAGWAVGVKKKKREGSGLGPDGDGFGFVFF